jgi:hypothetical protein
MRMSPKRFSASLFTWPRPAASPLREEWTAESGVLLLSDDHDRNHSVDHRIDG